MNSLYAMRRANGDWFALDNGEGFGVPLFQSRNAAMIARSRETNMECFRPVHLDEKNFAELAKDGAADASYWLVSDPLRKLSRGRSLDHQELKRLWVSEYSPAMHAGAGS